MKNWKIDKNTKSKIQCFLKEKQMFYLERQNPKYGNMIKKIKGKIE